MTGGVQLGERAVRMCSAARYSAAAAFARARLSPSALLTAIMSASSTRPFLRPRISSAAPGSISARKKSVMSATAVSDWPIPTVSTKMASKPAASQASMVSRVFAAPPPSGPAAGEGRMKALSAAASRAMRVLSARIEPPVRAEEGSTASTATRWPAPVRYVPIASTVVDLPTPGAARAGQEIRHQRARRLLVIGALRLDQRDRAREHGALAGADAAREAFKVGQLAARAHASGLVFADDDRQRTLELGLGGGRPREGQQGLTRRDPAAVRAARAAELGARRRGGGRLVERAHDVDPVGDHAGDPVLDALDLRPRAAALDDEILAGERDRREGGDLEARLVEGAGFTTVPAGHADLGSLRGGPAQLVEMDFDVRSEHGLRPGHQRGGRLDAARQQQGRGQGAWGRFCQIHRHLQATSTPQRVSQPVQHPGKPLLFQCPTI